MAPQQPRHNVNFAPPRSFGRVLKGHLEETLFPDDPFNDFKNEPFLIRTKKTIQYFVPICEWLPKYNFRLFKYDLLAGITIASLAIPQGISYAKLADIPPIIGLYSSFVPPFIYAVFGSSKHLAVGNVAAASLLIASTIGEVVSAKKDLELYVSLVFTAAFVSGLVQAALGFFRMGIIVDFLSHSTILGFMGGTAVIICLQQLKGILGMQHFTTKTDVVSVLKAVFQNSHEWRWESAVIGIIFLTFLQLSRFVKTKKPKLFWVSAIAPIITVIIGCLFTYFYHSADKHGIKTVGPLKKGINPVSIQRLNFDKRYFPAAIRAGVITALIALAEGIAIARSFAILKNETIDGNKEMIAFGLMNIIGSFTSCYLTTGPFSKTAVNYNSGCKTAMSNIVMAVLMGLTLLFLAPVFSYTPLVALSAIIMSAMLGLIEYEKAYHLFKTDKFDFCICMACFLGVAFISMDVGLLLSVGLALVRALLYIARPPTCKVGNVADSNLYRDIEQYPGSNMIPGILTLKLGSPIYFANCGYLRERIYRYVTEEKGISKAVDLLQYIILDLGGVTSLDITGVETLVEIRKNLEAKDIKMILVNPRLAVMEKLSVTNFIDQIGKDNVFLSIEDAVNACRFSLQRSKRSNVTE